MTLDGPLPVSAKTPPGPPTGPAPRRSVPAQASGRRWMHRESSAAYAFLAPNLLLLLVFVFVPLVGAVVVSFQETNGFGAGTFVGLDNYARLVDDSRFWRASLNTVLFTAIVTPVGMGLGLLVAILLNSVLPARAVLRTVLILPMAVSGVATALLGLLLFDQNSGLLDLLLRAVGLPGVAWQSDGGWAFASVVLVTLWWRVGFNMLIYLAALQGINPALYESARLDGASWWQRLRYVTVPMVGPASFFLVVLNVIYSFHLFDIVYVLTGGGPADATSVLVTYAYENAFGTREQGYAAAIGMVLLLITLVFTAVQWRMSRTRDLVE